MEARRGESVGRWGRWIRNAEEVEFVLEEGDLVYEGGLFSF